MTIRASSGRIVVSFQMEGATKVANNMPNVSRSPAAPREVCTSLRNHELPPAWRGHPSRGARGLRTAPQRLLDTQQIGRIEGLEAKRLELFGAAGQVHEQAMY